MILSLAVWSGLNVYFLKNDRAYETNCSENYLIVGAGGDGFEWSVSGEVAGFGGGCDRRSDRGADQ